MHFQRRLLGLDTPHRHQVTCALISCILRLTVVYVLFYALVDARLISLLALALQNYHPFA